MSAKSLEEIYARIPDAHCKKLCGLDVCGPVTMGEAERLAALKALGHPPESHAFTPMNEAVEELLSGKMIPRNCPALKNGLCAIYNCASGHLSALGRCEGVAMSAWLHAEP